MSREIEGKKVDVRRRWGKINHPGEIHTGHKRLFNQWHTRKRETNTFVVGNASLCFTLDPTFTVSAALRPMGQIKESDLNNADPLI